MYMFLNTENSWWSCSINFFSPESLPKDSTGVTRFQRAIYAARCRSFIKILPFWMNFIIVTRTSLLWSLNSWDFWDKMTSYSVIYFHMQLQWKCQSLSGIHFGISKNTAYKLSKISIFNTLIFPEQPRLQRLCSLLFKFHLTISQSESAHTHQGAIPHTDWAPWPNLWPLRTTVVALTSQRQPREVTFVYRFQTLTALPKQSSYYLLDISFFP